MNTQRVIRLERLRVLVFFVLSQAVGFGLAATGNVHSSPIQFMVGMLLLFPGIVVDDLKKQCEELIKSGSKGCRLTPDLRVVPGEAPLASAMPYDQLHYIASMLVSISVAC